MSNSYLSPYSRFFQSDLTIGLRHHPVAFVSLVIFAILCLLAAFAPLLAPFDPFDTTQIDILNSERPPFWAEGAEPAFLFGTDDQGRDMWSIMLYGLRLSLIIGLGAVLVQTLIGVSIGLISGYVGGRVDSLLMRLADIQLSFSTLMIAIVFLALTQVVGGRAFFAQYAPFLLIVIIGLAEWPQYARTVRATVLAEKQKEYVDAARIMGFGPMRIMVRHILPNSLASIFVISTIQIANAIIAEASLSFLGLGMPIAYPSLGSLIASGFDYLFSGSWWITTLPALLLVVLILVVNLLGDWLRDSIAPQHVPEAG
ncbi:ABC transporter permease [Maritalea sp. S77]|jgi:peptide/nickel transport system permease protein|uniref:ABC transporter permease n=1 Tax=Maritalea sp. S77 TaxID=3415125 RepID=UPI003C7DD982